MNLGGKYHLACIMKVKMKSLSCVQLFATSWTISYQAPLSMQFSRQEYWSGLPLPTPAESYQPRDQTHLSCISSTGRRILYHCATGTFTVKIKLVHIDN